MSDFNWNNVSRNLEVINLLEERKKIEEKVKSLDEFALVKYEYEILGLDQANEDSKETEKALAINDVSSSNGFTRHSTCCNEEVTVIGEVTKYYQCNYCKQPCDTEMLEDEKS